MEERVKEAVMASFVGDALALGVHWIYNVRVIDRKYGRVEELLVPELASFHKGKAKGEFTHYGDQMMVLLKSVAQNGGFDAEGFMAAWVGLMKGGTCYLDKASQATLENLGAGAAFDEAGSESTDLAGAARIAPLLLGNHISAGELAQLAATETALTHANMAVTDAAAYFACVARLVLDGCGPVEALSLALDEAGGGAELREGVTMGLQSRETPTREAIAEFGQMCEIEASLPSTVHLIARHEKSLKEALIENVMAGGDSAARGMLAGLILGARHGLDAVPEAWVTGMVQHQQVLALMDRV
ncbi:ADP-ribosylglycohydrolase family protein [Desulfoluna spongiiphila]|uniref:ADP-ribosylglycohydrolase family protein n=1 Tax=Desulfoluna spongiiphila TaxID=419481 RepID=UPI001256A3EE|nr:ADP-ribosylglycohydrolase family protein [Desulfoluna spongiiphila]VVS94230.1 adp-ribosylation/crystallin j1 [Desulfoluna spongiiphila]